MTGNNHSTLSHIADFYNRYPGEIVNFHSLLLLDRIEQGMVLSILLPKGIRLLDYECPDHIPVNSLSIFDTEEGTLLTWKLNEGFASGSQYEFTTKGIIQTQERDTYLQSKAGLHDQSGFEICSEISQIQIRLQGSYLNYLPEIYRQDELMGRFLMLFESFWKPIDAQIRQISCYFDPDLTPEVFLPWLAFWVGAYRDEILPSQRKRLLIRNSVLLYQRRGTKYALEKMLEIYSNGSVKILEHPAHNLVLGDKAHLGHRVALGMQNYPHTFSVEIKVEANDFIFPGKIDDEKREKLVRQKLDGIIEAQKPAHTAHQLKLTMTPSRISEQGTLQDIRKENP